MKDNNQMTLNRLMQRFWVFPTLLSLKVFIVGLGLSPSVMSAEAAPNVEVTAINARLDRLERMADNPVLLQLSRRLAEQQREIQGLYDQIDRLKFEMSNFKEQEAKRYRDTDMRLTDIEADRSTIEASDELKIPLAENVPLTPALLPENVAVATPVTSETSVETNSKEPIKRLDEASTKQDSLAIKTRAANDEEKVAYQAAFDLMKKKQYTESIKSFETFRQQYPTSSLASNAAYWTGEGYLILGEKDKAITSFTVVETQYADSSKAPAALFRKADTLRDAGQKAAAKVLYQKVIDQYPTTKVADRAKTRISGLEK